MKAVLSGFRAIFHAGKTLISGPTGAAQHVASSPGCAGRLGVRAHLASLFLGISPSASILTLARRLSAYLALLDALEAIIWFGALAIVP